MATFCMTVGPTLEYLWLEEVEIGCCPCTSGSRPGWDDEWTMCTDDDYGSESAWYDTSMVLNRTLKRLDDIENINIHLSEDIGSQLAWKLGEMLGFEEDIFSGPFLLKEYLMDYFLKSRKVGFAFFLVHDFNADDEYSIDESWIRQWDEWKEQYPP